MKKIICLLISALIMSCSQVNMPITQDNRVTPKPVQSQTVIVNSQIKTDAKVLVEIKPEIKLSTSPTPLSTLDPTNYNSSAIDKNVTPVPTQTPTITPIPSTNFIQVVGTPLPYESGLSQPLTVGDISQIPAPIKYHNPDTIIEPTPEGNSELLLSLYFKDIYRIRYNKEKNEFYSLSGYDTSSINKILIANSIEITISSSYTEEYMDKMEKERQEVETGDVPHYGSIYYIRKSELISNVEFVEMVRAHPYVRSFNYYNVSPISG